MGGGGGLLQPAAVEGHTIATAAMDSEDAVPVSEQAGGGQRAHPRPLQHAKTTCCCSHSATSSSKVVGDEVGADSEKDTTEEYRSLMRRQSNKSLESKPGPELPVDELDQLESLFREVDMNGDGVVDFEEFKTVMTRLGGKTGRKFNILQLKGLFHLADSDGSGSIAFNEFLHAQRRVAKAWGSEKSSSMLASAMEGLHGKEESDLRR